MFLAACWEQKAMIAAMLIWMGADVAKINSFKLTAQCEARGEVYFETVFFLNIELRFL